jgi:hypothetical protein
MANSERESQQARAIRKMPQLWERNFLKIEMRLPAAGLLNVPSIFSLVPDNHEDEEYVQCEANSADNRLGKNNSQQKWVHCRHVQPKKFNELKQ